MKFLPHKTTMSETKAPSILSIRSGYTNTNFGWSQLLWFSMQVNLLSTYESNDKEGDLTSNGRVRR